MWFDSGQGNVWEQVESAAKELAFNIPAREVEEILGGQEQSYFLPGPGQWRQQHPRVASILGFDVIYMCNERLFFFVLLI